jgi:hypothetical protein
LKVDIDIEETFGIEIKLAKDLKNASQIHRLIGQAIYYQRRKYKDFLIVLIIGNANELDSPLMTELTDFFEEIDVQSVLLKTTNG